MCILSTGTLIVMCIAIGARADKQNDEKATSPSGTGLYNSTSDLDSNLFPDYYSTWSDWSKCTKNCQQTRKRKCLKPMICGKSRIKEKRKCKRKKGHCVIVSYKIHNSTEKNSRMVDTLYDLFYHPWTTWRPCNRRCIRKRKRKCKSPICHGGYLEEERKCTNTDGVCQKSLVIRPNKPRKSHQQNADNKARTNYTCGIRPSGSERSLRIVGGRESRPHSWPWQVQILAKRKKHLCGGTLIHPQWILTAAHCISKKKLLKKIRVRLGEHNRKIKEGTEIESRVEKVYPYHMFNYDAVMHDIGLIKLARPIPMTNFTGIACLPDHNFKIQKGGLCTTIGWGRKSITALKGSDTLHEVQLPVVRKKKCKKAFTFPINNSQICAGFKKGSRDACIGDSGGPLMCPVEKEGGVKQWVVVGVTSYGEGCGEKGKYGLYTKVSKYRNWIRRTMKS